MVSKLSEAGRGGSARQSRANDDDFEFTLVGRINQLKVETVAIPFFFEGAARYVGI
jgi:hypothetical protein